MHLIYFLDIYIFAAVVGTVIFISSVAIYSRSGYNKALFYLGLAICIYIYGYGQELSSKTFDELLFWNYFQYLGIPFVSALWLVISLMYNGYFYPVKIWKILFIFAIPTITLISRFTNDFHHLYFSNIDYIDNAGRLLIQKDFGIWIYVQLVHSGSMVTISFILYLNSFIRRREEDGPKINYMLAASFFAILGLFLNTVNPGNIKVDYMALLLPLCVITVVFAVRKHDFLEVKTLARNIIFKNSADGMILIDKKNNIVDFNNAARNYYKSYGIQLKKECLKSILSDYPELLDEIESDNKQTRTLEKDNKTYHYELLNYPIKRENGYYGKLKIIRDITEKQLLLDNLKKQASIDELSGLLNRREFVNIGKEMLQNRSNDLIGLMMIDIDFFKKINDTYGHSVGDMVIREIGSLFRENFRDNDLTARIGGEEFAVIMEADNSALFSEKAEKFRKTVEASSIKYNEEELFYTISIGIAVYEDADNISINQFMVDADKALYGAKESGRNRVCQFSLTRKPVH